MKNIYLWVGFSSLFLNVAYGIHVAAVYIVGQLRARRIGSQRARASRLNPLASPSPTNNPTGQFWSMP